MTRSKQFRFLFLALLLNGSISFAQDALGNFDRFLGNWKVKSKDGFIHESWKRNADGSYAGESWTIKTNGDSIHTEFIRIHMLNDNIWYEPIVKNQHGGKPVAFRLILSSSKEWIFCNPDNDFPKYISYKWIDENHLNASISNSDSDAEQGMLFNYEKY